MFDSIEEKPKTESTEVALRKELAEALEKAKTITVIKTATDYTIVGTVLKGVKAYIKKAEAYWEDPVKKAHDLHKDLKKKANDMIKPAEAVEVKAKQLIADYEDLQEKQRKEAEAEALEKQRKEAEKLTKKAEKEEAKGNTEKAAVLRQQAEVTQNMVPVVPEAVKLDGISSSDKYTARVVDLPALIKYCHETKSQEGLIIANQKELDSIGQKTSGSRQIPGVVFEKEKIISARAS